MHTWNYRDNRDKKQNYRDRRISIIAQPYITPLQFYEQFMKPVFNMSDKVSSSQNLISIYYMFYVVLLCIVYSCKSYVLVLIHTYSDKY